VHSNPAPGVDEPTRVAVPSDPADDPVRRLLGVPADPVRHLGLRHWLGLLGLVAAIAVAAFVMPPLITPATPPAPRDAAARLSSAPPSAVPPPAPSPAGAGASSAPAAAGAPTRPTSASGAARPPLPHRPSRAPSPSAARGTPKRATAITVQAEAGTLSLGAAPVGCGTCEGGARVRFVGRVDVRARIPSTRTYDVTVVYEVDGMRSLDVSIDGRPPLARRTVTGHSWTLPQRLTIRAPLPAGPIDIELYGDAGNAPDIDAVTIS